MKNVNINKPNHVAIIMDGNGRWAKLKGKIVFMVTKMESNLSKKLWNMLQKLK